MQVRRIAISIDKTTPKVIFGFDIPKDLIELCERINHKAPKHPRPAFYDPYFERIILILPDIVYALEDLLLLKLNDKMQIVPKHKGKRLCQTRSGTYYEAPNNNINVDLYRLLCMMITHEQIHHDIYHNIDDYPNDTSFTMGFDNIANGVEDYIEGREVL